MVIVFCEDCSVEEPQRGVMGNEAVDMGMIRPLLISGSEISRVNHETR